MIPGEWLALNSVRDDKSNHHQSCQDNPDNSTTTSMRLYVKTLAGTTYSLQVHRTDTILQVKTKLQEKCGAPTGHQLLKTLQGRILENDCKTLKDYEIIQPETILRLTQGRSLGSNKNFQPFRAGEWQSTTQALFTPC
jgi:Ubiquitin family